MISFAGARGVLPDDYMSHLERIGVDHGCGLQIVRSSAVFGRVHLISAVKHALRSHGRGRQRARKVEMEVLLYLAGERQIGRALELVGAEGEEHVIIAFSKDGRGDPDGAVREALKCLRLERDDSLIESPSEREMMEALERTALLDVMR